MESVRATSLSGKVSQFLHLIPGTTALVDDYWRSLVLPYYSGEIVVGKDLLEVA